MRQARLTFFAHAGEKDLARVFFAEGIAHLLCGPGNTLGVLSIIHNSANGREPGSAPVLTFE